MRSATLPGCTGRMSLCRWKARQRLRLGAHTWQDSPRPPATQSPQGVGSPKGRGPGLRGLHRLMDRSGGRGHAAEGQGQRDISPAPAPRPRDREDWCSVHLSKTQASRDPPNRQHGSPTQDMCAAQDHSREASPKVTDRPRERWGAREMTPSHLRHRRRGMRVSPQRMGRHVSGQQSLLFPPLGPEAARLRGQAPSSSEDSPLTAGTRSEQSRWEDPIKPPGRTDRVRARTDRHAGETDNRQERPEQGPAWGQPGGVRGWDWPSPLQGVKGGTRWVSFSSMAAVLPLPSWSGSH